MGFGFGGGGRGGGTAVTPEYVYYQPQEQQAPQQAAQPNWNQGGNVQWAGQQIDPRVQAQRQEQIARINAMRQHAQNDPRLAEWQANLAKQNQGAPDINSYMSKNQQQLLDNLMKNQQYKNRPEYASQAAMLKGNAKREYDQRMAYMNWQNRAQNMKSQGSEAFSPMSMMGLRRNRQRGFDQKGYEQWKQQGMPIGVKAPQGSSQQSLGLLARMLRNRNG